MAYFRVMSADLGQKRGIPSCPSREHLNAMWKNLQCKESGTDVEKYLNALVLVLV